MKASVVVLMTATIDTGQFIGMAAKNDSLRRREEYKKALSFWMNSGDERIKGVVFCENSGANILDLIQLGKKYEMPSEFIGFSGNVMPNGVHYGYAELGIIDYALSRSSLIKEHKFFVKVTGRLVLPNFSKLLDSIPDDFQAIFDSRIKYRNEPGFKTRVRTQVMIFDYSFYEKRLLRCRNEMVGDCSHIEEFLAKKLSFYGESNGLIIPRFPIECLITGRGGSKEDTYYSFSSKIKVFLRSVLRQILPFWWL